MKRNINRLMPILLATLFVFSACAKKEVIRNDAAPVSSQTVAAEAAPSQTAVTGDAGVKEAAPTAAQASARQLADRDVSRQTGEPSVTPLPQELQKIYFDFDAATLSAAARDTLTGNSQVLKSNPQLTLRIEGHCDERGSDDYNLALSERRAQAALRYLTDLGIPAERLSTIGYGKEKPADPGHDEAAWARNRRDEFVVLK